MTSTVTEAAQVAFLENTADESSEAAQVAAHPNRAEEEPTSIAMEADKLASPDTAVKDETTVHTEASSLETTAEEEPPAKPQPKRCVVCETEESKYKCPRCQSPYCSILCFRTHKENHPPDPPKPAPVSAVATETTANQTKSRKRKHPFSVLDDSPDLDRLFKKYPRLPSKLARIHAATLPPKDAPQPPGPGGLPWNLSQAPGYQSNKPKWSHDTGFKRGKKALREARTDPTEDGDAVREYCELVLYLLAKEKDEGANVDVTDLVRQQVTNEDIKLIEKLIEEEQNLN